MWYAFLFFIKWYTFFSENALRLPYFFLSCSISLLWSEDSISSPVRSYSQLP